MTVQVNVKLNGSFLNVMHLMTCTDNCSCLQSFLAAQFQGSTKCVSRTCLHTMYPVCVFELFSTCNDVSTCAVHVL